MLASTPGDTEFSPRTVISALFSKLVTRQMYHRKIWLVTGFEKSAEIAVLGLIRVSQEKNPPSFSNISRFKVKNIDFEGSSLCY